MYKILSYRHLGGTTSEMVVEAPKIARKAQAGQFFILRIDQEGERVPLTIADSDAEAGTITMVFQVAGRSTEQLSRMRAGDELYDMVGPLGQPSDIKKYGTVVIVGGGVGIAPIHPIAKSLREAGNYVISIIGAKTADLLFWKDRMDAVSDEVRVATDDGSLGHKGFVTEILQDLCENQQVDAVWAVGPMIMMRGAVKVTEPYDIPTFVSMNPIMIDGTGMCGGCRVQVGDETKFACVDGPEFDGRLIDWNLAMNRSRYMKDLEVKGKEYFDHQCNLGLDENAKAKVGGDA